MQMEVKCHMFLRERESLHNYSPTMRWYWRTLLNYGFLEYCRLLVDILTLAGVSLSHSLSGSTKPGTGIYVPLTLVPVHTSVRKLHAGTAYLTSDWMILKNTFIGCLVDDVIVRRHQAPSSSGILHMVHNIKLSKNPEELSPENRETMWAWIKEHEEWVRRLLTSPFFSLTHFNTIKQNFPTKQNCDVENLNTFQSLF